MTHPTVEWFCVGDVVRISFDSSLGYGKIVGMRGRPGGGHDCLVQFTDSEEWYTCPTLMVVISAYDRSGHFVPLSQLLQYATSTVQNRIAWESSQLDVLRKEEGTVAFYTSRLGSNWCRHDDQWGRDFARWDVPGTILPTMIDVRDGYGSMMFVRISSHPISGQDLSVIAELIWESCKNALGVHLGKTQ